MLLLLLAVPSYAQDTTDDGTCLAFVNETIVTTLDACQGLARESVCTNGAGDLPVDTANLVDVPVLNSPATAGTAYGVSVLNTSATLTQVDGGVLYMLLGDATLENRVDPENALAVVDPIQVTTTANSNLRSRPSVNDTVLDSVNSGTQLLADGLSADGEWVRVTKDDTPLWISRSLVRAEGLDTLPTITASARSLMQDFALRAPLSSDCTGTVNALVIQALDNQPINLTVNRADIRVRGTVAVRSESRTYAEFATDPLFFAEFSALLAEAPAAEGATCDFTELSALDGEAFLNNGQLSIPRGYRAFAFDCRDEGTVSWQRTATMTVEQLNAFAVLEGLPVEVLRLPVTVPTMGDIALTTSQIAGAAATVNTNTAAPDTEENEVAPPTTTLTNGTCPGFVPTSPIVTIPFGQVRFYWDPAPGAANYQVNVFNYEGELVSVARSQGAETSARVDTTSPRFSIVTNRTPPMSYEVIAFDEGGNVLCRTPMLNLIRDFDPDPDCPPWLWYSGTCEDVIINDP
jgi:hypothetical protein